MKRLLVLPLILTAVFSFGDANAQRATEVYIPIGESPGVSGSRSLVGKILALEGDGHRMIVATGTGERTVTMTEKTRYFLDSSGGSKRNVTGSYADCEVGRYVEAFIDDNGDAIWVKIAAVD